VELENDASYASISFTKKSNNSTVTCLVVHDLNMFSCALSRGEDLSLFFTVRAGDDVTLSCKNVAAGHSNCDTTTWLYTKSGQTAVELINLGQVKQTRSDRLNYLLSKSWFKGKPVNQSVELENDASYASISFTKKSNNSTVKHKDEFDTVTYTIVKASSPDPSSLYASIK
ncbi:hypothetical protein XENOCAPTIV_018262, partial [Xenoophorus captivus]